MKKSTSVQLKTTELGEISSAKLAKQSPSLQPAAKNKMAKPNKSVKPLNTVKPTKQAKMPKNAAEAPQAAAATSTTVKDKSALPAKPIATAKAAISEPKSATVANKPIPKPKAAEIAVSKPKYAPLPAAKASDGGFKFAGANVKKISNKSLVTACLIVCVLAISVVLLYQSFAIADNTVADEAVTKGATLPQMAVGIQIDDEYQQVYTMATTVGELLVEQGIKPNSEDTVTPELSTELSDGLHITIKSPIMLTIIIGENQYQLDFQGQTVSEAISQAGLVLSASDIISLPLDTVLVGGETITVQRIHHQTITELVPVEPLEERFEDPSLAVGETKVIEEGEPGEEENIIQITYQDGVEISREIIATNAITSPGVTMIAYGSETVLTADGTAGTAQAVSSDGVSFSYTRALTMESTAYTWTGNTTATGTWPTRGQIAVDPNVIPLGSKVYVEGYGFATATDTGGAIKGNIIDVYFDSYDECIIWGRKHGLTVYVIE